MLISLIFVFVFYYGSPTSIVRAAPFDAANFMTLFFHKESADANSTYNTLSLTPPEPTAYTELSDTTIVDPSKPCEMAGTLGPTHNQATGEGDLGSYTCVATFYGPPIGNTISITSGDSSIKVVAWVSDTVATPTGGFGFQFYRLSGLQRLVLYTGGAGDSIVDATDDKTKKVVAEKGAVGQPTEGAAPFQFGTVALGAEKGGFADILEPSEGPPPFQQPSDGGTQKSAGESSE